MILEIESTCCVVRGFSPFHYLECFRVGMNFGALGSQPLSIWRLLLSGWAGCSSRCPRCNKFEPRPWASFLGQETRPAALEGQPSCSQIASNSTQSSREHHHHHHHHLYTTLPPVFLNFIRFHFTFRSRLTLGMLFRF